MFAVIIIGAIIMYLAIWSIVRGRIKRGEIK